jgi:flagellin
MRINQNIAAFNAYRNLSVTSNQQAKSLEKLSSGFRINRAADDASGLVNSENLRAQIGGLKVATRNAQDAISLVQTAEGAQTEVHTILQRMRDLAVQSANEGANDTAALEANQSEIDQLKSELSRIAGQTQFGTKAILTGEATEVDQATIDAATGGDLVTALKGLDADFNTTLTALEGDVDTATSQAEVDAADAAINEFFASVNVAGGKTLADYATADSTYSFGAGAAGDPNVNTVAYTLGSDDFAGGEDIYFGGEQSFTFQVGANSGQNVTVGVASVFASQLGTDTDKVSGLDVTVDGGADAALDVLDAAISQVSDNRATLGAFQNRMESTIRNVSVATENLQAAESRIRDVDMAEEMVNFTRHQIMQQAGTAMLAQANQVPQSVLSLLR